MSLAQHYRRLARAAAWYGDHASARIYTQQALRYNADFEGKHPRKEDGEFAAKGDAAPGGKSVPPLLAKAIQSKARRADYHNLYEGFGRAWQMEGGKHRGMSEQIDQIQKQMSNVVRVGLEEVEPHRRRMQEYREALTAQVYYVAGVIKKVLEDQGFGEFIPDVDERLEAVEDKLGEQFAKSMESLEQLEHLYQLEKKGKVSESKVDAAEIRHLNNVDFHERTERVRDRLYAVENDILKALRKAITEQYSRSADFREDDHPRDEKGRFAHKEARAALQSWHAENVSQGYQGARAEARQKTVDTVTQLGKASRTLGVNDAAAVREHLEQAGKSWESLRSHAHDWVSAVEGYLQEHLSDVATDDFLADNRDTIEEAFAEADKEAGEKIKAIHAAIQSKKRIKERIGDVKGQIGDLRSQQAKLRKDAAKMEADSTKQLDKADDRIEAGSDLVDEMLEWAEDQLVQGVTGYEDWVEKEPPHTWNTPPKLGDYPTTAGKDAAHHVAGTLSGLSQRLEQYLADLGPKYGPLADKILKQWDKKIGKWQDSNLDPIAGHVDAHVKLYADAQAAMREAGEIDGKLGELHSKAEDLGYEYNNANDDHHAAVDELVDVEEGLRNTLHETLTGMVEEVDAELVEEPEEDEPEDEDSDLYARSPLRYNADFERLHPRKKGGKFAPKGQGEEKVGESAKGTPKDGAVIKEGKTGNTKTIYSDGKAVHTYKNVPKQVHFQSDLLNDDNQNLCGGWQVKDEPERLVQQLESKKKPFGVVNFLPQNKDAAEKAKAKLDKAGLVTVLHKRPHQGWNFDHMWDLMACQDMKVKDIGDLEALKKDYAQVFESGREEDTIDDYADRHLSSFFDGWDSPPLPLWLTGLILGYPVENTVSLYLS